MRIVHCIASWAFIGTSSAFIVPKNEILKSKLAARDQHLRQIAAASRLQMLPTDETVANADLHVVLFGLGDLRVNDHGGLHRAMDVARKRGGESKVLPLFVLDEKCLMNFPGCRTASADTATMVSSAIQSLSNRLRDDVGLDLQIRIGTTEQGITDAISECQISSSAAAAIHVCDLGPADNAMKYGPLPFVPSSSSKQFADSIVVVPWKCDLRSMPWDAVSSLPKKYPDYQTKFCSGKDATRPIPAPQKIREGETMRIPTHTHTHTAVPTESDVMNVIAMGLFGQSAASAASRTTTTTTAAALLPDDRAAARVEMEKSTGLFGTHWGGSNGAICDEADVLEGLRVYAEVEGDDDAVLHSEWYRDKLTVNPQSLEHASIRWMMSNPNQNPNQNQNEKQKQGSTKNLLRGELMTRYMAAPLTLGCVSVRQLWHALPSMAGNTSFLWRFIVSSAPPPPSPLRDIAEANEWHKLFAAQNICNDAEFQHHNDGKQAGEMSYAYWRWNGFLCRYAVSSLVDDTDTGTSNNIADASSSLVLIHGFGASGSQWSKNVKELAKGCAAGSGAITSADDVIAPPKVAFAPDLIGFGQCEKPGVTYTQYLWESYAGSFVKEIVQGRYSCGDYVVGGNSIGGYTSMSCAADDGVPVDASFVSASGAPGSGKCRGVFLMNSAGQIRGKEEVMEAGVSSSVAETTIAGDLPPCSPPARSIALAFGNGLLWYLRPRIQSICVNLYPSNPAAVDDNLCGGILRDSLDPGAINVMVSGSKLPAPRTANDLLNSDFGTRIGKDEATVQQGRWGGPAIVIQGMQDPLQNSQERVAGFTGLRSGIDLEALTGGHCPHDELPKETADALLRWIPRALSNQQQGATEVQRGVNSK